MWATGLKSVTMTIRTDKFCFGENFYVSVIVLPNDEKCHRQAKSADECHLDNTLLQQQNLVKNGSSTWRQKEVRVRINKILDKSHYIAPIIAAVVIMAGLVLTSYLVVRYKKYDDLIEKDSEENKESHDAELVEKGVENPPEGGGGGWVIPQSNVPEPDAVDGHLSDTQAAHDFCKTCTEKIELKERGDFF